MYKHLHASFVCIVIILTSRLFVNMLFMGIFFPSLLESEQRQRHVVFFCVVWLHNCNFYVELINLD